MDYSAVMSIVGFISSHIARSSERRIPLKSLVQLITSVSINHRTVNAATNVIRALAKVVPQWVTIQPNEVLVFNADLKTFDVLTKLRILKRAQQQQGLFH